LAKQLQFKVVGEDPRACAAPLFSNFVGISHSGKEVQFEFLFLDINVVAQQLQTEPEAEAEVIEPKPFEAKTVAKVVVPSWAFMQLREHLNTIFEKLAVQDEQEEASKERKHGI